MRTNVAIRVALLVWFAVAGCSKLAGNPQIAQQCTMNGFGAGACSFTNTGEGAGTVCGKIVVNIKRGVGGAREADTVESAKFCSGSVAPKSTAKVDFAVTDLDDLCTSRDIPRWSDLCEFGFVADK